MKVHNLLPFDEIYIFKSFHVVNKDGDKEL